MFRAIKSGVKKLGEGYSSSSSSSDSSLDSTGSGQGWRGTGLTRKEYRKQRKMERKMARDRRKIEKQARKMQARYGQDVFLSAVSGATGTPANQFSTPTATAIPVAAVAYDPVDIQPARVLTLTAIRSQNIDERTPEYAAHGLVRVDQGELVQLVDGSLEFGLPPPYSDYVLVRTKDGRVGKVGRKCFA